VLKEAGETPALCRNCIARKLAIQVFPSRKMSIETVYPQQVEYQASFVLETQRIPDAYHFLLKDGKLFSPVTGLPAEKSITRRDSLEEAEYQAFLQIQDWFVQNEAGLVVWINPSFPNRYGCAKAIISEIVSTTSLEKALVNRAVCFDWDEETCLAFARSLGLSRVNSGWELRTNPVFLDKGASEGVIGLIAKHSPSQAQLIISGQDFIIKERMMAEIASGYLPPSGDYLSSCGSALKIFTENSSQVGWEYNEGTCRICGKETSVGPCKICRVCERIL